MQVERKYEQWKAITESDFVTLFIKTWFTFIAILRELNPGVDVFTEDGMPRGDKPFLNAYNELYNQYQTVREDAQRLDTIRHNIEQTLGRKIEHKQEQER